MPSKEVEDAVGEAPPRTPEQQAAAELRAEESAKVRHRAEQIAAKRKAQDEAVALRERVVAWWAALPARVEPAVKAVLDAVEESRSAAAALTAAMEREQEARAALYGLPDAIRLMRVRWPDLAPVSTPAIPRVDQPDYLAEPLRVGDVTYRRRPRFEPGGHRASAGVLERRRDELLAMATFVERHGAEIPDEVLRLVEPIPGPDEGAPGWQAEVQATNRRTAGPGAADVMRAMPGSVAGGV